MIFPLFFVLFLRLITKTILLACPIDEVKQNLNRSLISLFSIFSILSNRIERAFKFLGVNNFETFSVPFALILEL